MEGTPRLTPFFSVVFLVGEPSSKKETVTGHLAGGPRNNHSDGLSGFRAFPPIRFQRRPAAWRGQPCHLARGIQGLSDWKAPLERSLESVVWIGRELNP